MIDASGITIKRLADIRESLNSRARAAFGNSVNVANDSVLGKVIGVFAGELSLVYELIQQAYDSLDPDQAEGSQLDNVCALIGVNREAARPTAGTIAITGTIGTLILENSIFETESGIQFRTIAETTLVSTSLTTGSITFAATGRTITRATGTWLADGVTVGTIVTIGATTSNNGAFTVATMAGNVITVSEAVTNETAATPTATIGLALVSAEAIEDGEQEVLSAEINGIVTAISGVNAVVNPDDMTTGVNVQTDAELRIARESSLQITGAGVDYAIRAKVLALTTVDQCVVVNNRTDATDVDGRPRNSFEVVVWPDVGDDQAIVETIFLHQPAGILAYGSTAATVTDAQGFAQSVSFSYATARPMYIRATITTSAKYPSDGADKVAAALLAAGNTLNIGDDVEIWKFIAVLNGDAELGIEKIPGIVSVTIEIEEVDPPTNTANISIGSTQIATFDSARIEVV